MDAVSFELVLGRCLFRISAGNIVILRVPFLSLSRYISCAGGKIEKNEMGRVCGAYGGG